MEKLLELQEITESKPKEDGSEQINSKKMTNSKNCECGCGNKIKYKPYHKYYGFPRFIYNHHNKGVRNPAKRPEVKEKIRLSKLGDLNPSKRPEVKQKIKEHHWTKLNYEVIKKKISNAVKKAMQRPEVKIKLREWKRPIKPDYLKNHETCQICKKIFIIPKSHHRRFCSRRCSTLYLNKIRKTEGTDIEIIFESYLKSKRLIYQKQKIIEGISIPDFFIKPNICIYCDGDYWHSIPRVQKRDKWINQQLEKKGFKVVRYSGSQIKRGEMQIENQIN